MQHPVPTHHPHPKRRRKWLWVVGVLAIGAGVLAAYAFGGNEPRPEEVEVTRGTVVETVSVTGRVKPASSVDLAFERSGKIARVLAKVGDRVEARVALVELSADDLRAEVREAEAQVATETANLEALTRGTRPEEITVKNAEVAKVEQDLANYYTAALVIVEDAYAKADDAVRVKTDALFSNDDTSTLSLTFSVSDSQAQGDVVDLRRRAGTTLGTWNAELRNVRASTTPSSVSALLISSATHLALVRDYLARAVDAVNFSVGLTQATADAYRGDITTGRTNVAAATTAVSGASQNLAAQALTVARVRSELALLTAGATAEAISAQRAKLLQAEARRDVAQAALAKTVITAPFAGLVTKQDAEVGEIVAANTPLVSLIAERSLEIEAFIPEVDVGKVSVGNTAAVTFDAYGAARVFSVRVGQIEPAETVVEGVATYRTVFHFADSDREAYELIKSGMTADLEIETARRENVLMVPFRALRERNGGGWFAYFVGREGALTERGVLIGLRGTDGTVEVREGLSEGDTIVAAPPRE